jgi:hypothetical protein
VKWIWLTDSIIASQGSLFVADSCEDLADSYDLGDNTCSGANSLNSRTLPATDEKLSLPIYPKTFK